MIKCLRLTPPAPAPMNEPTDEPQGHHNGSAGDHEAMKVEMERSPASTCKFVGSPDDFLTRAKQKNNKGVGMDADTG